MYTRMALYKYTNVNVCVCILKYNFCVYTLRYLKYVQNEWRMFNLKTRRCRVPERVGVLIKYQKRLCLQFISDFCTHSINQIFVFWQQRRRRFRFIFKTDFRSIVRVHGHWGEMKLITKRRKLFSLPSAMTTSSSYYLSYYIMYTVLSYGRLL